LFRLKWCLDIKFGQLPEMAQSDYHLNRGDNWMADDYARQLAEHLRKKKEDANLETKKLLLEQELKRTEGPKLFHDLREFLESTIRDANTALNESILEMQGSPAVGKFTVLATVPPRRNKIEVILEPNTASIKYSLVLGSSRSDGYFTVRITNGELGYTFNNHQVTSIKKMGEMLLDWVTEKRANT
jgi:hypothetical protein